MPRRTRPFIEASDGGPDRREPRAMQFIAVVADVTEARSRWHPSSSTDTQEHDQPLTIPTVSVRRPARVR